MSNLVLTQLGWLENKPKKKNKNKNKNKKKQIKHEKKIKKTQEFLDKKDQTQNKWRTRITFQLKASNVQPKLDQISSKQRHGFIRKHV
jgi:predicted secreted protein